VGAGVLLAAVLLLLTSCQQAPVPRPAAKAASPAEQLMNEGHGFMAKGDYANAAERYHQAADLEPAAIPPRFALGTAYSFQEKRAEAIVQFRWVLASADAASTEYQGAHRWLARVGALPAPAAVADGGRPNVSSTPDPSSTGRLVGKVEWGELNPKSQLITGNLSLIGDEPVTHDVKRTRAFRLGDGYEFKDVPAGRYRMVAVIDETTVWDEKVTVEAGKDTSFTLRQSTSPVPATRFAPGVSPAR
jgi:tetratricopeptide (TPR) repeat protein